VHLADGHTAQFDLVVCADGPQSVGRRLLFPTQSLQYVGYILWRGLAEEQAVANSVMGSPGVDAISSVWLRDSA